VFDARTTVNDYYNQSEFDKIITPLINSGFGTNILYVVPKDPDSSYEYHLESLSTNDMIKNLINGQVKTIAHREFFSKSVLYGQGQDE
jgi:hypothetical protein